MKKKKMGLAIVTAAMVLAGVTAQAMSPTSILTLNTEDAIVRTCTIPGPAPAGDSRIVGNAGLLSLEYSVHLLPNVTWLQVAPTFGSLCHGETEAVAISFDVSGLAAGSYFTEIRFQNDAHPENYEVTPVYLQVNMPPADLDVVPPDPIVEQYDIHGPIPPDYVRTVMNIGCGPQPPGGAPLVWALQMPVVSWVHACPQAGVVLCGQSTPVTISFDVAGLAPGFYSTVMRFQNLADTLDFVEIPVSLNVRLPKSDLFVDKVNQIAINYTIGSPDPLPEVRTVSNWGDVYSKLSWALSETPNASWLQFSSTNGLLDQGMAQPVTFTFLPAGIPAGMYHTMVRFQNVDNPADYEEFLVTLAVNQPPADLTVVPAGPVTRLYDIGGPVPVNEMLTISNAGVAASQLLWERQGPSVPWLHVDPGLGVLAGGQSEVVTISFDISGLPAGKYGSAVRFQNLLVPNDFVEFPVTLEVRQPLADLVLDSSAPIAVAFDIGGPAPAPVTRVVSNGGDDYSMLGWALSETPNATWLQFGPTSGTLAKGAATPVLFTIDPTGLPKGLYQTLVRFQNVADLGDFEEFLVTLTVNMPAADLTLDSTAAVNEEYIIGFTVPPDIVRFVSNSGPVGSALTWSVAADPPAPWLFIAPTSGVLDPGASKKVVATYNLVDLPDGLYKTTLRFENAADPADFELVSVTLKVTDPIPDLGVVGDPATIDVTYVIGQPQPADVPVVVENRGHPNGTLNFGVMKLLPASWLGILPASGTIGPLGSPKTINLSFDPTNLDPGFYETILRFENLNDIGDYHETYVTFTVEMPDPDLTLDSTAPVVEEYVIGFDVPLPVLRTVTNNGPVGSELNWIVYADPPAPWLFIGPTAGMLESGKSQQVEAVFNLVNLPHGVYKTTLRFENIDDPLDFEEVQVQLTVTDPIPDLALQGDPTSVTIGYTIGEPVPADFPVVVENRGHVMATLHYAITVETPVSWLTVTPMSGTIMPNELTQNVSLAFQPVGLPDGTYETVLRFENLEDELDFVELPVTLTIGNIVFVPGDVLIGGINLFEKTHEVEFDGVAGMRLKFKVTSPDGKTKLQIVLVDPQGEVVAARKLKASKKGVKKSIKLQTSGRHSLRVEIFKGELGGYEATTGRKLPKKARKYKIVKNGGSDGILRAPVLALPNATLDLVARPQGKFEGPLGLGVTTPSGSTFNATAFTQSTGDGGVRLTGVPLVDVGKWVVGINGFGNKLKNVAKVTVKPVQPPKGTDTIFLP